MEYDRIKTFENITTSIYSIMALIELDRVKYEK